MRIRHLTLESVSLGALILLCTVWWSEGEAPQHLQPVITTNDVSATHVSEVRPSLPRRHVHSECASCPDVVLEAHKIEEALLRAARNGGEWNGTPVCSRIQDAFPRDFSVSLRERKEES